MRIPGNVGLRDEGVANSDLFASKTVKLRQTLKGFNLSIAMGAAIAEPMVWASIYFFVLAAEMVGVPFLSRQNPVRVILDEFGVMECGTCPENRDDADWAGLHGF